MYKFTFPDNLWLPFIDQPQSDEVVFAIISFDVYKYLVITWKGGIFINEIYTLNEKLENMSTSIVRLKNIDESQ